MRYTDYDDIFFNSMRLIIREAIIIKFKSIYGVKQDKYHTGF